MKKSFIKIALLLFAVLMLSGCGSKTVSKSQIQKDIEQYEDYAHLNVKTTNFSIIKRQTNEMDKEDTVWVNICGENEDFSVVRNYEVLYRLYNDGWMLENVSYYHNENENAVESSVPFHGVSEDDAKEFLSTLDLNYFFSFDAISLIDMEVNEQPVRIESNVGKEPDYYGFREVFYYEVTYKSSIFNEVVLVPIEFIFNCYYGGDGWRPYINDEMLFDHRMELNEGILGTWEYHNTAGHHNHHIYVEISEFSSDGCIISADWYDYVSNEEYHTSGHMALNYEIGSNGKINVYTPCLEWDDGIERNYENCVNLSYPLDIDMNRMGSVYSTVYGFGTYFLEMYYDYHLYKMNN